MNTNSSVAGGAGYLKIFHDQIAIRQFVKSTYLYAMADVKRTKEKGAYIYRFWLMNAATFTPSTSILTQGIPPASEIVSLYSKDVTPTEYGVMTEITNLAANDLPFDIYAETTFELGRRFAEVVDLVVQSALNSGATRAINGDGSLGDNTASGISSITTTMVATAKLLAQAQANLRKAAVPELDGGYVAVMNPYCAYDLLTESSTGGFVDVAKYKNPESIYNGEIGQLYGIRIILSANIAALSTLGASSQAVYPIYVLGQKAYGIVEDTGGLQTYVVPHSQINQANPIGQFGSVGLRLRFGVTMLKPESLILIRVSSKTVVI